MLDLSFATPAAILAPGDVVLFRFPLAEGADGSGVKLRPCLVFDRRSLGGDEFLDLAYGTSSRTRSNVGYELHINRHDDIAAAGLDTPTRFICARRVLVHPRHRGFGRGPGKDPFLGRISPELAVRLDDLRGKVRQAMIEGWARQPKLTLLPYNPRK